MTHICVSKPTIIGSDNGLSPDRRQVIIRTSAGILLIGPLGTNFSEILIEIHAFSFKKMHLKMLSGKWRPFCLGLNVLRWPHIIVCWIEMNVSMIKVTEDWFITPTMHGWRVLWAVPPSSVCLTVHMFFQYWITSIVIPSPLSVNWVTSFTCNHVMVH